MTRLLSLPTPTYEGDPQREAVVGELRALRARLSLCAGRMGPSREAIMQEVERVERVVRELRALAERL